MGSQAQSTLEGGRLRGQSERKKKTFLHLIPTKFCEGSFFWPLKEDPETSQHTLQCPPSAANTTHVSDNFAQDYIWYILRTKVENWESFVYHNFYFYYFLSLAKTACFLHHQQPDNLKMRDTAAYMSQKLFNFSRVLTMMVGFNRQHCQTTYYPPWKKKTWTSQRVNGNEGICWKLSLSAWWMFWVSSPAKR